MNDRIVDIEDLNTKYDQEIHRVFDEPTAADVMKYGALLSELCDPLNTTPVAVLKRRHGCAQKNSFVFQLYLLKKQMMKLDVSDSLDACVREKLRIKKGKSHSGVISVTVFTSSHPEYTDPATGERVKQGFSCAWNCAYCPNEPGQPRSYLKGEPGVMRANREGFDCVRQMFARMTQLFLTGHPIDKLEVLVLGGTWESYPHPYREEFVRDIYYAANVFRDHQANATLRDRMSLSEEQDINAYDAGVCRVIGLTLETRPDTITPEAIRLLRYYGCTRVQLGIQHIDPTILHKIKRHCTTEKTVQAIRLLKNCGFKIDGHWMPNLPESTVEMDRDMFCRQLLGVEHKTYYHVSSKTTQGTVPQYHERWDLTRPDLQVDQWKVYPCTIVPFTEIEKWYKEGSYIPYSQDAMKDMLLQMKALVFPWIRLNRIIRDIPECYSLRSDYNASLRNDLEAILRKDGWYCSCIRCREVKGGQIDMDTAVTRVHEYNASGGTEHFISYESRDGHVLYGFLRLRIPGTTQNHEAFSVFPELEGCALIRELHVYGKLQEVGSKHNSNFQNAVQHKGVGRMLLKLAEDIAKQNGYKKLSVISGEGTRAYYSKNGYHAAEGAGRFMVKHIHDGS